MQTLPVKGGMLFEEVARLAQTKWNGNKNIGLVVGATDPDSLAKARAAAPDLWILAPGVGFQGGNSRRRDCHLMAPPVSLVGVSIGINRGCHQNDSLAGG